MLKQENKISSNKLSLKIEKEFNNSQEYIKNQAQINCITKVLIENADVPPLLIDWLIDCVQKNTTIRNNFLNNIK